MPSENGSRESTSSSSASPPSVIIWYISFSLLVMTENPAMNSSNRCLRSSSKYFLCWSRRSVILSSSPTLCRYSSSYYGQRRDIGKQDGGSVKMQFGESGFIGHKCRVGLLCLYIDLKSINKGQKKQ